MAQPVTTLEQWNIDARINGARSAYQLEIGETILQVVKGGISEDWQETWATISKESRIVKPSSSATRPPADDPGPLAAT